jgi:two-component system NtrC family response regulator
VESVLFGHEKGSFTGADRVREGLILQADGGTLFLDEVGELPPDIQKTFLRVLQERRYRPIGGRREQESDFRLVAATNRDLEQMVRDGLFREDLYFRLRTFMINLPPLRTHRGDIAELAMNQIAKLAKRYGVSVKGLSPEFLETLLQYEWPGNVRELLNTVERAFAQAQDEPILFPYHLPADLRVKARLSSAQKGQAFGEAVRKASSSPTPFPKLQVVRKGAIEQAEKGYVAELLRLTGGDMKEAARTSGLSRSQIYRLMQKHGIRRPAGTST